MYRVEVGFDTADSSLTVTTPSGDLLIDDFFVAADLRSFVGLDQCPEPELATEIASQVRFVATGTFPMAPTQLGDRIFVTNQLSDTVSVIDVETLAVVETTPTGLGPIPGFAAFDRIWVINDSEATITVIDAASLATEKHRSPNCRLRYSGPGRHDLGLAARIRVASLN